MAIPTDFPTGEALFNSLVEKGILSGTYVADGNCDIAIAEAISEFKGIVNATPYIASGSSYERIFDYPIDGWFIFPDTGVVELVAISVEGTALVEDESYWLYPEDSAPYYAVQMEASPLSLLRTLSITADWGWASELDPGAYATILRRGQYKIEFDKFGGKIQTEVQGPVKVTYGSSKQSGTIVTPGDDDDFMASCERFARKTIGSAL